MCVCLKIALYIILQTINCVLFIIQSDQRGAFLQTIAGHIRKQLKLKKEFQFQNINWNLRDTVVSITYIIYF